MRLRRTTMVSERTRVTARGGRRVETTTPPPPSGPDVVPAATALTPGDALVTITGAPPPDLAEHVSTEYFPFVSGARQRSRWE